MSFDAFEARLQFLQLLRKLNASAQSIQKVVGFAVKYGAKCGEDLWEVVMDECEKVSVATSVHPALVFAPHLAGMVVAVFVYLHESDTYIQRQGDCCQMPN